MNGIEIKTEVLFKGHTYTFSLRATEEDLEEYIEIHTKDLKEKVIEVINNHQKSLVNDKN